MSKPVQEHRGKELIVRYDPNICLHAGECVRGLPPVFDVQKRPWVTVEGANSEATIQTIDACPSGALSYERVKVS